MLQYLQEISGLVNVPLLRKDFIIDSYQLYESNVAGADAVLLITAILEENQLIEYIRLADELHMAALVEVHNEDELRRALKSKAEIIGINNRNLRTFEIDLQTTFKLIKMITKDDHLVVSESGIKGKEDIKTLKEAGINAVLIGESLMRAENIGEKIKEYIV